MFLLFFTHTQTKNDPKNLGSCGGNKVYTHEKARNDSRGVSSFCASHGIWRSLGNPDTILPEFAGSTGKCLPARVRVGALMLPIGWMFCRMLGSILVRQKK